MDFNKPKHIIPFLIIGSFIMFIISAVLSSFFIITLPLADDWCKDGDTIQIGEDEYEYVCFEFKNEAEALKYYHNKDMLKRNKYLVGINYIIGYLFTSLCFCFIPKWRNKINIKNLKVNLLVSIGIAFAISIVGVLFYSWILPPPINWFPEFFRNMNYEKINELNLEIQKYTGIYSN